MSEQTPWLVLFDADRIKEYVFATGRLKEIRGASLTVASLTAEGSIAAYVRAWPGAELIYAGGGAGKVKFSSEEEAERFQRWLEDGYRRETISASMTSVRVPYRDDFRETVKRGERALRRAKDAGLGLAAETPEGTGWALTGVRSTRQPPGSPFSHFCQSCGVHPAVAYYRSRQQWVCAACGAKRRTMDELRGDAGDREDEPLPLEMDLYGREFLGFLEDVRPSEVADWWQASFPQNLGKLGQTSRPENYLGFLYADGDRIGELLELLEREKEYRLISQILDQATREAAYDALAQHFPQPSGDELLAPFEVVMIGGDDLIMLVAAHRALEVAITFGREFSRRFEKLVRAKDAELSQRLEEICREKDLTWPPSVSVGVVLAHASQPILYLEQRAGELLKLAKKQRFAGGGIDYLVVTSPTLNPVRQARKQAYEDVHESLHRTRRPYSLSQLDSLLAWARQLKFGAEPAPGEGGATEDEAGSFPRNKLIALYEAVFRSREQSMFEATHLLGRLSSDHRQLICQLAEELGFHDHFPWGRRPEDPQWEWQTALPDLVEILDFVRRPEEG